MVFKYKRKSARAEGWTEEGMSLALQAIETQKSSIRGAAKQFNIPYPTLRKHVKKQSSAKQLGRFKPVFSAEMEFQLVKHIQDMDIRFYGFTKEDLCTLAFEFATRNDLPNTFKDGRAGDQWYYNFMQRHPELSLRRPECTSIARACGFNRPQVQIFFDNLKIVREKHNIGLDNIYNVDETGIQTSTKRPPKVISVKGKKQVGAVASTERGQLVTAICCCSASGKFIPPCLIFPRKKRNPRYLEGTPPGTVDFVSDNGWVNSEIFLDWMKFFVKSVRPTAEQKCLLILDNHTSHRSLAVVEYASANNVVLLSVPPHCTHKLQPLDVSVYGPLGTYFERAIDKWQKKHPAQRVTLYEIGQIFGTAYLQAITPQNAINGFTKTGITDGDIDVFSDIDFAPADVTNVEQSSITNEDFGLTEGEIVESIEPLCFGESSVHETAEEFEAQKRTPSPKIMASLVSRPSTKESSSSAEDFVATTETLKDYDSTKNSSQVAGSSSVGKSHFISFQEIKQLPKIVPKITTRKRKAQKSEILTSTPVKENLRLQQTPKRTKKVKNAKRKVLNDLKLKCPAPPPPAATDPTEEDVPCLVCGDTYGHSKPGEQWIQCNMCEGWAHQLCTIYKSGVYICDICKEEVLKMR